MTILLYSEFFMFFQDTKIIKIFKDDFHTSRLALKCSDLF
jgi:hypothetical protein